MEKNIQLIAGFRKIWQLSLKHLTVGDFNAHNNLWLSTCTPDTRGNNLADSINGLDYGFLNEDQPTRVTNLAFTAPDISIAWTNIIPITTWKVDSKLTSDHLPITISLTADFKKSNSDNLTFINIKKADWPKKACNREQLCSIE